MARTKSAAWAAAVCTLALSVSLPLEADRAPAQSPAPVSMTGCLRASRSGYVLTGLRGNQAPKARNWKTGYIMTTRDFVVSPTAGVKLQDHIGRQVTVVGVVDGTRITARTIRRIATSCS
jgi:hypothetical protein